jgi:hypothetical protein
MNEANEMVPVVIESPYAGADWTKAEDRNIRYLRACMRDCLLRCEAPYASHGLYTQPGVLRDDVPEERMHGIRAGFAFRPLVKKTVVYTDLGFSGGMKFGISDAEKIGHPIEYRQLGGEWTTP